MGFHKVLMKILKKNNRDAAGTFHRKFGFGHMMPKPHRMDLHMSRKPGHKPHKMGHHEMNSTMFHRRHHKIHGKKHQIKHHRCPCSSLSSNSSEGESPADTIEEEQTGCEQHGKGNTNCISEHSHKKPSSEMPQIMHKEQSKPDHKTDYVSYMMPTPCGMLQMMHKKHKVGPLKKHSHMLHKMHEMRHHMAHKLGKRIHHKVLKPKETRLSDDMDYHKINHIKNRAVHISRSRSVD